MNKFITKQGPRLAAFAAGIVLLSFTANAQDLVNSKKVNNVAGGVIKFNNNEIAGNILPQIDFPDKIVFNKNRWYAHKDNRIRELPDIKVTMSSTDSIKNILGYRCRKYNVKEPVGGQQFYVWVCKDLPITLMPGGGYHPFPGAVLEMVYPERGARFIATSITKI